MIELGWARDLLPSTCEYMSNEVKGFISEGNCGDSVTEEKSDLT